MATTSGFFDIDSGSGGTVVVSGLPFPPKAAVFFSLLDVNNFAQPGTYVFCLGMASRTGLQASQQFLVASGSPAHFSDTTCVYTTGRVITYGATTDGLEITDWVNDGWTFSRTDGASRIFYIAWGGNTLRSESGTFDVLASGGDTSVTGLGFGPQLVLGMPGRSSSTEARYSFGAATAAEQWANALYVGEDPMRGGNARYSSGLFLRQATDPSTDEWTAELASMDAGGFTVSPVIPPASDEEVFYLALSDTHSDSGFAVGDQLWDDAPATITGLGFAPEAVMISAPFTLDATFTSFLYGLGMKATIEANITGGVIYNAIGDSDPWVPPRYSLEDSSGAASSLWLPPSIFGLMGTNPATEIGDTVVDLDPDGFTANMTTAVQSTPVGDIPAGWPDAQAVPWFWIATGTSPDRSQQQIWRYR